MEFPLISALDYTSNLQAESGNDQLCLESGVLATFRRPREGYPGKGAGSGCATCLVDVLTYTGGLRRPEWVSAWDSL